MGEIRLDIDPEWLEVEQAMGGRVTLPREPVEDSRARFQALFSNIEKLLPPPSDAVKSQDVYIAENQRMRIFAPVLAVEGKDQALPVGLYPHCGGWYAGSIEMEDFLCRNVAENARMIIFSPDYRLAPEHPYPAGFNDVCFAYEWMYQNAVKYDGNPKKKFISREQKMGGSAGGNLSACVAVKYAADPELSVSGLIAACFPSCDPSAMPSEYKGRLREQEFKSTPMLGTDIVKLAREWYNAPPDDPLSSPLLHPDLHLVKQAYIAATTADPTYQETRFFYEELKKKGVKAELVEWVGWPHYFWILPMFAKSNEFMDVWNAQLRRMIDAA
ncbi:hypothetical protein H2200_000266 [Cladophialophora chaetospira]|uniref:Alpha/beta hydrolase fold-3 domain-containing protein n=1 Tax=Cladophialophora chaetospira TaxID=386627 RepID=A0AA38XN85_9EURO|nr:hypothetical protein H2200_000266 [Cladophialophora chaetospira]